MAALAGGPGPVVRPAFVQSEISQKFCVSVCLSVLPGNFHFRLDFQHHLVVAVASSWPHPFADAGSCVGRRHLANVDPCARCDFLLTERVHCHLTMEIRAETVDSDRAAAVQLRQLPQLLRNSMLPTQRSRQMMRMCLIDLMTKKLKYY